MSRSAKQIFLILSSCIICINNANATSNLPPLPISDNSEFVPSQSATKPTLNDAQETADSINIDQFINDVDKKITEKVVTNNAEEDITNTTNSNEPLRKLAPDEEMQGTYRGEDRSVQQLSEDLNTKVTPASPSGTALPKRSNEVVLERIVPLEQQKSIQKDKLDLTAPEEKEATITAKQIQPAISLDENQQQNTKSLLEEQQKTTVKVPANDAVITHTTEVTIQPVTQDKTTKTTQSAKSNTIASENVNTPAAAPTINSPSLLVPAYDSEQPKPEVLRNLSDNTQQTTAVPDSFIEDELKVALYLAPDDISIGKLTEDAYLDQISFAEYHNIFWQKYYESQRAEQRKMIELFINNYDKKFNQ